MVLSYTSTLLLFTYTNLLYLITYCNYCIDALNEWFTIHSRCAVAEWYGAGLAIARSRARIPPTATVYQRQLSVPSLRGRLMSTSERWGVNGHTT